MIDSKMDIEEDYEDQIDNTNHDEEKDISNKRVLTLSSILRKLIHESDQENSMKKIVKRNQLTSREQTVINHLVNVLRPYAAIKTDHPAYTIPMVVLGIHVLTAYGYNKFVKSVFPIITPATIHSVDLDERTLYEITAERFVIPLNDQSIMTNSIDAEDHPDLIFHAFFDDGFIKQHVRRNQQFDHRIIFIPGSDMMGIQYIERREKSPMQQMASTTAATNGYDIDAFSSTITWDDDSGPSQLKDLQKKKAKQQKHMRELTKAIKDAKSNHRTVSQGDHDSILDVEMLPNDERDNIQGIDEVCHEISALSIVGDTPDTEMSCREEQDTIFKLKQTRSALYECIAKATDDISTLNTAKFAASLEKVK